MATNNGAQHITYYPKFLNQHEINTLFYACLHRIHWQSETIQVYGRQHQVPRLVAWIADSDVNYTYSGVLHQPDAWLSELMTLKTAIEARAQTTFNSVLANRYRNGQDSIGWHADDEKTLGPQPVIASISLGATRAFKIRSRTSKKVQQTLHLVSGSLLVMEPGFQILYQHSLAKTKKPVGERINLTFRQVTWQLNSK